MEKATSNQFRNSKRFPRQSFIAYDHEDDQQFAFIFARVVDEHVIRGQQANFPCCLLV